MPNIRSERPAETRDFFVGLLGFEVAMDIGWVVTVASPANPSAQVTIIGNDDPVTADNQWAQIDRALTDEAAWIAWATPKRVRFFGKRAGNYQFHPVWNTLLDQIWVH